MMRVLLLEDEYMIAQSLAWLLEDSLGCEVVMMPTIAHALDALEQTTFAAAVLDLNVQGQSAQPVIDRCVTLGLPVIIQSGYTDLEDIQTHGQDIQFFEKPFDASQLTQALAEMICLKQSAA